MPGVPQTGHEPTTSPADPSRVSAARHAHRLPSVAVAAERSSAPSPVVPLLVLVIGLAAAAVWFVALPALDRPPRAERSCEVYVLASGATKCVPRPKLQSRAVPSKPKRSGRAKH